MAQIGLTGQARSQPYRQNSVRAIAPCQIRRSVRAELCPSVASTVPRASVARRCLRATANIDSIADKRQSIEAASAIRRLRPECKLVFGSIPGLKSKPRQSRPRSFVAVHLWPRMFYGRVPLGEDADLRARMRMGIKDALRRHGHARRVSGTSLAALMCASALAPVITAGSAIDPTFLAGVGVVGAVGAGILTEVVNDVIDHLRESGEEVSESSIEERLSTRLEQVLQNQDESAPALRKAVAALLHEMDAVAVMLAAAADIDQELLRLIGEGFAGLGEQFSEFAFAVNDEREALWQIEEELRLEQASRRAEQERARETSLILLRLLEAVEKKPIVNKADFRDMTVGFDPVWRECPYLGLMPFDERHAKIFYGRRDLTGQLVQQLPERLLGDGMLVITGVSGAGKSSLLRAGLMPRMAAGTIGLGSSGWPRRVLRPTASPLRELAVHLADIVGLEPLPLYHSLSQTPDQAPLIIEQALIRLSPNVGRCVPDSAVITPPPRVVLVIDQFEELFIAGEDNMPARLEREAFIVALNAAASVPVGCTGMPGALVIIAVRGDFLGQIIALPELAAAMAAGPFTVGPMTEAELRLAITGPAAEAGLSLEPGLVDTILSDVRGRGVGDGLGSGVLPLIFRLWLPRGSAAKAKPSPARVPTLRWTPTQSTVVLRRPINPSPIGSRTWPALCSPSLRLLPPTGS